MSSLVNFVINNKKYVPVSGKHKMPLYYLNLSTEMKRDLWQFSSDWPTFRAWTGHSQASATNTGKGKEDIAKGCEDVGFVSCFPYNVERELKNVEFGFFFFLTGYMCCFCIDI